jgi:alanine dehydrogenase
LGDILVLSRKDVESVLDMSSTIKAMEDVFAAAQKKEADSVGVLHIDASKYGGGWSIKPGYLADKGYAGVKLGCGYPGNLAKGLPSIYAVVVLGDAKTGIPIAILDGGYITAVRTGATGGVAAKYLARHDSRIVGVVGTGTQGRMQVLALKTLFNKIAEVRAYDIDEKRLSAYIKEMRQKLGVSVTGAESPEKAVKGADIVVTVTPSRKPYLKKEWLGPGVHINAFGADSLGKFELEAEVYKNAKLVTDKIEVALEKKLFGRRDIYAELGEVVTGEKKGRETSTERTIFDSTGIGIQDIAAASLAYEKAKKLGIGKSVPLI